jgi:cell division protein FtsW (lipid II flippase)
MSRDSTSRTQGGLIVALGAIAFLAGMLLAIIAGGVERDNGTIVLVLVILGIIVGLFNITSREMIPFLVAAVALVVVGTVGAFSSLDDIIDGLGRVLNGMVDYISVFMTPAAIITAIRVVWSLARPGD